jgi:hypothetical protein
MEPYRMKNIIEIVKIFFQSIKVAHQASNLAAAGRYNEARKLFEKDLEVHP